MAFIILYYAPRYWRQTGHRLLILHPCQDQIRSEQLRAGRKADIEVVMRPTAFLGPERVLAFLSLPDGPAAGRAPSPVESAFSTVQSLILSETHPQMLSGAFPETTTELRCSLDR